LATSCRLAGAGTGRGERSLPGGEGLLGWAGSPASRARPEDMPIGAGARSTDHLSSRHLPIAGLCCIATVGMVLIVGRMTDCRHHGSRRVDAVLSGPSVGLRVFSRAEEHFGAGDLDGAVAVHDAPDRIPEAHDPWASGVGVQDPADRVPVAVGHRERQFCVADLHWSVKVGALCGLKGLGHAVMAPFLSARR
jgi:hypothetical protein